MSCPGVCLIYSVSIHWWFSISQKLIFTNVFMVISRISFHFPSSMLGFCLSWAYTALGNAVSVSDFISASVLLCLKLFPWNYQQILRVSTSSACLLFPSFKIIWHFQYLLLMPCFSDLRWLIFFCEILIGNLLIFNMLLTLGSDSP